MAVFTLDNDNNILTILVEKSDRICNKNKGVTEITNAKNFNVGKMFIAGEQNVYMIRGERES